MARTGLTNFVTWAIVTLCVGVFLLPLTALLLVAGVSLGVALFARVWPEALGVAAGVAAIFVFAAASSPVFLLGAATIGVSTLVIWRQRATLAATATLTTPPAPPVDASASPRRLTVATLVASLGIFVMNFVVSIGTGFSCNDDARPGAPGSDRAAWCDALSNHHAWAVILSVPSAVVFLGGIWAASRGRAREVMMFVLAGFALVIAVHVPDFVF